MLQIKPAFWLNVISGFAMFLSFAVNQKLFKAVDWISQLLELISDSGNFHILPYSKLSNQGGFSSVFSECDQRLILPKCQLVFNKL